MLSEKGEQVIQRLVKAAFGAPLVTNVLRGLLAEAIIANTLGDDWRWCSADYASWDFERDDGLYLEVKQSASRQSWATAESRPSSCSFDIRQRQEQVALQVWGAPISRAAHLYVFAHHPVADATADHREPEQWRFYIVPAAKLPDTKTIGLARVQTLSSSYGASELAQAIKAAAANIELQGCAG